MCDVGKEFYLGLEDLDIFLILEFLNLELPFAFDTPHD